MSECLEYVDWFLRNVGSWAVNPSQYRKHHQGTLYTNAQEARRSLQVVLEDLRKQLLPQQEEGSL